MITLYKQGVLKNIYLAAALEEITAIKCLGVLFSLPALSLPRNHGANPATEKNNYLRNLNGDKSYHLSTNVL